MKKSTISLATLKRLPTYLGYLREAKLESNYISSGTISESLHLNEIQVRKDLASVCDKGKPKVGYPIEGLIKDIESYLGYHNVSDAVIIGAGKLGRALLAYQGFQEYGLNVVAAFDHHLDYVDESNKIFHISKFEELIKRLNVKIGIITVGKENAQTVANLLISQGVKAIWNFAPTHLEVSDDVIVLNENLAASFAVLSKALQQNI